MNTKESPTTETKAKDIIDICLASPSETNFIRHSWMIGFFRGFSSFCEHIPEDIYRKFHPKIIQGILERDTTRVLVAFPKDQHDVIAGYIVYEVPNIVHWIYVKVAFRGFGVGKELFEKSGMPKNFTYTHRTSNMNWIHGFKAQGEWNAGKYPNATYNPYAT